MFDGTQLVVVDGRSVPLASGGTSNENLLYQIATDGTLIDQVDLSPVISTLGVRVALVGDAIYLLASSGASFDAFLILIPTRSRIPSLFPFFPCDPPFSGASGFFNLSQSIDGQSLLGFGTDDRVYVIDPLTARVTSVIHEPNLLDGFEYGATSVGGELFVSGNGTNGIVVLDDQFQYIRSLPNVALNELAGGTQLDNGQTVTVTGGSTSTAVDLGHESLLVTLSGTLRADANGDGVFETGDPIRQGVTVYLDANRNGVLDQDEVTSVTDALGAYEFAGLVPGEHVVRAVDQVDTRTYAVADDQVVLFDLQVTDDNSSATIRKIDPISGEILIEFPAPGQPTTDGGLAVDSDSLYYSSPEGFWVLDPITGSERSYMPLPTGTYTGAAAIDEMVYLLDGSNDLILQI